MICCTFIALFFGVAIWAVRKLRFKGQRIIADPLQWALSDVENVGPQGRRDKFDWYARAQSFRYAFNGVGLVLRHEHSAWIHLSAGVVVLGLGWVLQIDLAAWRWIIACIGLVLFAEAINTAIEAACDAISLDHHPLIGKAKDIGAGAVLICAMTALAIGVLTLAPFVL